MKFSGHDTFHCRLFWLKKGFDYVSQGEQFKDNSGVELGVGRNMVNSIRFWMNSFGVLQENYQIPSLHNRIFSENGWDPYLENETTLWLLHYELCEINFSAIYRLIFRDFRKMKPEFTRANFINFVKDIDPNQNEKILKKDFSVFLRMYSNQKAIKVEDGYSGLLTELGLVKELGKNTNGEQVYRVQNNNQREIPIELLLYCIITNENYENSISFKNLYNNESGVGTIFCFDQDILESKLIELAKTYSFLTYSSEAGIKELQFKEKPNPKKILETYYNA